MSINRLLVDARRPAQALMVGVFVMASMFINNSNAEIPDYPESKTGDVVDVFHGVKVADPYRWLEDLQSPDTTQWVKQQNGSIAHTTEQQLTLLHPA